MSTRLALLALALLGCTDDAPRLEGTVLCTDCAPGTVRRTVTSSVPFSQLTATGDGGVAVITHEEIVGGPVAILDADLANERVLDTLAFRIEAAGDDLYVMGRELQAFDATDEVRWSQDIVDPLGALSAGPDGAVVSPDGGRAIERFARDTGTSSPIAFESPQAVADPAGGLFVTSGEQLSMQTRDVVRFEGDSRDWTRTISATRGSVELGRPVPLPDHRVAVFGLFDGPALQAGELTIDNPAEQAASKTPFVVELAGDGTPVRLIALPAGFPYNAAIAAVGEQLLVFEPRDEGIMVSRLDGGGLTPLQLLGGARSIATVDATPVGLWLVIGTDPSATLDVGDVSLIPANGETVAIELAL